jgi:ribosome-binding protein aMBF1 (putative translation factor)
VADPGAALTPYAELAEVIESLPLLVREARRRRRLSIRAAAREMGMSFSTVHRIEQGDDCALSNAMTALRWLDGQHPDSSSNREEQP